MLKKGVRTFFKTVISYHFTSLDIMLYDYAAIYTKNLLLLHAVGCHFSVNDTRRKDRWREK